MNINELIKEPFVHFIFLGLLIFILNSYINGSNSKNNLIICIDKQVENSIRERFKSQWKRTPTEKEFDYLLDDYIKKEVLYREAISLNLDKNDEIIKRRLSQKMQALMNDFNTIQNEVSEEEIEEFYVKNKKRYSKPKRYSFYQVSFRHKNKNKAIHILKKYKNNNEIQQLIDLSEITIFPFYNANISKEQLISQFGGALPNEIENVQLNTLAGPYESGFGIHLIYIIKIDEAQPIPLEYVKDKVIGDIKHQSEIENQHKLSEELTNKYQILKSFESSGK